MASTPQKWSSMSEDEKKNVINSLESVVTDCDGVLWLGSKVLPGATDVMNGFKKLGKSIFFLTNNSTKTNADLAKKCADMGFDATVDEMVGTARLTALYLKSVNFNKKAYVIGMGSLEKELAAVGIETIGVGPDVFRQISGETLDLMERQNGIQEGVGAVIVGYDLNFSYPKLQKACTYLADPECLFIATNTDQGFPLPGGVFAPGCGAFVSAVSVASNREPIIMGKPAPHAVNLVLKAKGINPVKSVMFGDRCDTDICFGNQSNMKTLLVLTGVTSEKKLKEFEQNGNSHLLPTYYTPAIVDLAETIKKMIDSQTSK